MKTKKQAGLDWPNCAVCKFSQKTKSFKARIMASTYFNPEGIESVTEILRDYDNPFPLSTIYYHIQKHMQTQIAKAEILHGPLGVVEDPVNDGQHELGLDEFITEGRALLASGDMKVNAATYLAAIKIKADIEKSTKDRKLDAIKTFFAPRRETPDN